MGSRISTKLAARPWSAPAAATLLLLCNAACSSGPPASGNAQAAQPKDGEKAPPATGDASSGKGTPDRGAAVPVRVAEVTQKTVPRYIEISGSIAAPEDSAVAAEVEGKVVKVLADLGDRVRQGQVLAQIVPDEYRFRMEQAEAQSQQGESNLKRVDKLAKTEMVAPQQLDDAKSIATQARAAADLARKKFRDTEIRAPFNGAIAKRMVSTGEYVRVGQPLFQVVAIDQLKLTGEVAERYLSQVRAGDPVATEVEAYPGKIFNGTVSRISPAVNPISRAFTVEARIGNKDGALKPGLFARAKLSVGVAEHAIIVPAKAISMFAGVARIYKIDQNMAHEVRVELDQHLPDELVVVITDALKAGDKVAVEGLGKLSDGSEVVIR